MSKPPAKALNSAASVLPSSHDPSSSGVQQPSTILTIDPTLPLGLPSPPSPPPPYPSRIDNAVYHASRSRPTGYFIRALRSAAYPLRGIVYFVRRREFWPLFLGRLAPLCLVSFLVYFVLFAVVFLPQYAFLAIFHGWGAWLNAVVLVLAEGLIIIQGLFEGFLVDECRASVFDATLLDKNHADLVAPHRILFPDAPNSVRRLGAPTASTPLVFTPWSITQLAELVFFLPLNLVPVVGTPAFILITGSRLGKLSHYRWFVLRGLSKQETQREIKAREWEYLWFGTVVMVLELIPVLSLFFLLTSAAGAALWAAREEDLGAAGTSTQVVTGDGQGENDYHDDPVDV